jgi:feruloyl esterase
MLMASRSIEVVGVSIAAAFLIGATPVAEATACEDLAKVSLSNATITLARVVPAGAFTPPAGPARAGAGGQGSAFSELTAFCQVQATLRPTADSEIKVEVWLPAATSWNGKLQGVGNGGMGGGVGVNPVLLAGGVRRGYATVGTNSGHEGDSTYAIGHPEKVKDWGWRAYHEMTVTAKALIKAHYEKPLLRSVVAQVGGEAKLGLNAAQRFPEDYDAIVATNVITSFSRSAVFQFWGWMATHETEGSALSMQKLGALRQAVLNACDANDGLADGLIGQPERCKFDPGVVQCSGADAADCLTPPQVAAARKLYSGPVNPRTKEKLASPLFPGGELGWNGLTGAAQPSGVATGWFKGLVFQDPAWDYRTRPVNFDADVAVSDKVVDGNSTDPDLRKFFGKGGKLLLVNGWAEATTPPTAGIDYYKSVVAKVGEKLARDSMRLFVVPGMAHTPGTTGRENFNFDALSVIEQWADSGKAPDVLIVDHYKDGMLVGKRLACQYPMAAIYQGRGNTEDPSSYLCK